MKITLVLPQLSFSGGIRVLSIYARELSRMGHEIFVISQPPARPRLRTALRELVRKGKLPKAPVAQLGHFAHLGVPHRVLDRARPVVNSDVPDADVIIATWWITAEWVAELAPSKGRKVLFVQGHDAVEFADDPKIFRRANAAFRLPFQMITISEVMRDVLCNTYGQSDVQIVSNGVDTEQFDAPVRGKQRTPTVGFLYNEAPVKNCALAARAIDLARRTIPDLRVIAFGAERPARDIPLPPDTIFTLKPAQAEIGNLYASCDVWLLSSNHEGFGLPILEAMACRTPVIATPVGAAPEWVTKAGGRLVKLDDAEDMARAIVEMVNMPEPEWRAISDRGYAAVRQHDWKTAAREFEACLVRAVGKSVQG